jgi:hypothetical protein
MREIRTYGSVRGSAVIKSHSLIIKENLSLAGETHILQPIFFFPIAALYSTYAKSAEFAEK